MQKKRVLLAAAAMMAACSLATGTYRTDIWAEGSKNEIQKKTQKLENLNAQMADEIEQLDKKVSESNEKYEKYVKKQNNLEEQIKETKEELKEAKESREKQYETMKKRIKFMYENGDTAYLEIILKSESFQELVTKAEYVSKVAEYDSNMFKKLKKTEETIENASQKLEEDYDKVTKLVDQTKEEKDQLDKMVTAKKEKVQEYQKELSENEELLAVYEEAEQQDEDAAYVEADSAAVAISTESTQQSSTSADTGSSTETSAGTGASASTEDTASASTSTSSKPDTSTSTSSKPGASTSTSKKPSASTSTSSTSSSSTLLWPVPSLHTISSGYGYRVHPVTGVYKLHGGIDIPCSTGTTLVAAASGTVEVAGYSVYNGYYIKIDHGNGLETMYLHCSKLLVSAGDHVTRGQTIAKSGATGMVTGAHLHFVVKKNGSYVNPMNYL